VLTDDQIRRYARHILLPDVGGRGQERLLAGAVTVAIGPGRDAAVVAIAYLAAAGVGRLAIAGAPGVAIDGPLTDDEVRGGVLYGAADAGRPRLTALRERIAAINPDVAVVGAAAGGAAGDGALALDLAPTIDRSPSALAAALIEGGRAAAAAISRLVQDAAP
jgi:molybdopterin/thiamine biosynthesis adenylyltransferase